VVGVERQEDVERALHPRVGLIPEFAHPEHHRQEVPRVAQVVLGIDVGLGEQVAVGERRQGRHLGQHAHDLAVPRLLVMDLAGVRVEARQRPDRRRQHRHRMSVVVEPCRKLLMFSCTKFWMVTSCVHHSSCAARGKSPQISRYASSRNVECSHRASIR
jgi:hypothetical protein